MEYQQITPKEENDNINNKQMLNNINLNNNEIITERNNILEKISSIPENFNINLENIKQDFTNSYTIYLQSLLKNIGTYDTSIEQNIDSVNLKNNYYFQVNTLLRDMLDKKKNYLQDYLTNIVSITQNLLDKSIEDDFSKGNDFVEQIILKQKEEKQKEEIERIKKEEEKKMKKKEEEKQKKEEEMKKKLNKTKTKKSKTEINGEKENNINIQLLEGIVNFNIDKIILRKMSQEYLKKLFSQSYSIYAKLHNRNQSADYSINSAAIERTESAYSFNGETSIPISDKVKFFEKRNDMKVKDIIDISILDSTLEDINFVEYFPYIEELKIKNTKLSFNVAEKINFQKLDSLKLENVGLINENFNILFEQLRKNEIMRKNLRIFSVKNNNISFLDYKKGYADNILKTMTFKNLEVLDMSYNRIYLFQTKIFNSLDSIKLIDLTNNNIAFSTHLTELYKAAKVKKCLLLMTNNLAILKQKSNIEYNQYLIQILPEIYYPIKNITLDNNFTGNNYQDIFKIEISKFKNSLVYLNLSNGKLIDDDLILLFRNKWDFPYLKSLILESNYLTEQFLYAIINKNLNLDKKFLNLKVLKLSDNKINCPDVDKFIKLLETLKNLLIFEIKYTPFEQSINQYFRKKVMKSHDPNNKKINEHRYNQNEEKISKIIEENNLKEKTKATIIVIDLLGVKYTKYIFQHLQNLVERITLENKFQN